MKAEPKLTEDQIRAGLLNGTLLQAVTFFSQFDDAIQSFVKAFTKMAHVKGALNVSGIKLDKKIAKQMEARYPEIEASFDSKRLEEVSNLAAWPDFVSSLERYQRFQQKHQHLPDFTQRIRAKELLTCIALLKNSRKEVPPLVKLHESFVALVREHSAKESEKLRPVFEAAETGDLKVVADFLQQGGDPEIEDFKKGSLLLIASRTGQFETAKLLLKHGANPFKKSGAFEYPFTYLVAQDQIALLEGLQAKDIPESFLQSEDSVSQLVAEIVAKEKLPTLKRLALLGVSGPAIYSSYRVKKSIEQILKESTTAPELLGFLHAQGYRPDTGLVQELVNDQHLAQLDNALKGGFSLEELKGSFGASALAMSLQNKQYRAANLLMDRGAILSAAELKQLFRWSVPSELQSRLVGKDKLPAGSRELLEFIQSYREEQKGKSSDSGLTATFSRWGITPEKYPDLLQLAVSTNDAEIVKALLETGWDAGRPGVAHGVLRNFPELADLVLSQKIDPNQLDEEKESILFIAVRDGKADLVKKLLKLGANPHLKNAQEMEPLEYVVDRNDESIPNMLGILVAGGADLSRTDKFGTPHFHKLAYYFPVEALRNIWPKIREPLAVDAQGKNFLISTVQSGSAEIAKFLLESKFPVDHVDKNGFSAFAYASASGSVELVEMLLKHGANPKTTNREGVPAYMWAYHEGHEAAFRAIAKQLPEAAQQLKKTPPDYFSQKAKAKAEAEKLAILKNYQSQVERIEAQNLPPQMKEMMLKRALAQKDQLLKSSGTR